MKIEKEFTLLKIESKERTTKDNKTLNYLIISVLDENLVPCKFFAFKDETVKTILEELQKIKALSKVLISFDLNYDGKLWNCNFEDMLFNY